MLTVVTFAALILLPQIAPVLKNYETLETRDLPAVLALPRPGVRSELEPARRLQAAAPKYLVDPTHVLDRFYESLLKGGTTEILHYGDSVTTADLITSDARAMLQQEFGDGGSGFVLIARPWAWYKHRGVDMGASNWTANIAGLTQSNDGMEGLGGVSFSGSRGAIAHWRLRSSSPNRIEIAYLAQPGGGTFAVEAGNTKLGTVETASDTKSPGYAAFTIPSGATRFTLRVTRGKVRLYGADFRKSEPGVVYDNLGVHGANITLLSKAFNETHWAAELQHYKPDLVIVNYGTNESGFAQFVDGSWAPEMTSAVRRLNVALPGVPVLLMSPMDRGQRKLSGEIDTIPEMPRLVSIEERIARQTGAAFFNTFEAMGGEGTMARWYTAEPRLVGADFTHPLPAGARIVGELLFDALQNGYSQYKMRQLSNKSALQAQSKLR